MCTGHNNRPCNRPVLHRPQSFGVQLLWPQSFGVQLLWPQRIGVQLQLRNSSQLSQPLVLTEFLVTHVRSLLVFEKEKKRCVLKDRSPVKISHLPWSVEMTEVALSSELVALGLCDSISVGSPTHSCDTACYTVCVATHVLRFPVVMVMTSRDWSWLG